MACFIAPTVEAIAVTVVNHQLKKKEKEVEKLSPADSGREVEQSEKIPFSRKLSWLNNLLWGGSFLLLFEHIWHGEIVLYPPFLTAMSNPDDMMTMFKEIATTGVTMALLCTAVWCVMLIAAKRIETKRAKKAEV